jgi:hypothetical protein
MPRAEIMDLMNSDQLVSLNINLGKNSGQLVIFFNYQVILQPNYMVLDTLF